MRKLSVKTTPQVRMLGLESNANHCLFSSNAKKCVDSGSKHKTCNKTQVEIQVVDNKRLKCKQLFPEVRTLGLDSNANNCFFSSNAKQSNSNWNKTEGFDWYSNVNNCFIPT